jgi:DNA recombination protein RmuC
MLVTARKLNDLDENELGVEELNSPKVLEESASSITAKELEAGEQTRD